jgi:succinate-semialdehyde dehydrogenase/glutarate-semialdehyde dehydrogenase
MAIETRNPATSELARAFDALSEHDLAQRLERSHQVFREYRLSSMVERQRSMEHAATLLEESKSSLADLIVEEMGKIHREAVSEVEKCAWVCRYYAENAAAFLDDRQIETDAEQSFVRPLPLGPILAVMPWNFPFWQVFRFAAPTLMAGNTALLKHASNVPQCALAIESIFSKAGFRDGVFQTLLIGGDRVARMIEDERIAGVTVTGSEAVGRKVAAKAGEVLKPCVLELGGSDAFIVMPSADLDAAVETGVKARTMNNGQSCIAAKRFIVHEDVYDEVVARMEAKLSSLTIGDPMDATTDIGPLATGAIRSELAEQVDETLAGGARRICGAHPLDRPGNFYAPGMLADIPRSTPAFSEELFGPVALMFRARSLRDALSIANTSRFGLGSCIFTQDEGDMRAAIQDLEAGATFINSQVASDPRLPFGGVKASGYGRELSKEGILAFCNLKTVSQK